MAKTEISISNNLRKRAKIVISRNDETGTPLAAKIGITSAEIERQAKREVQNKSELNCGTVATLVEPENSFFNSPGLTLEKISTIRDCQTNFLRFEIACLWSGTIYTSFVLDQSCQVRVRSDLE